jgi:hypothetical protein
LSFLKNGEKLIGANMNQISDLNSVL